MKKFILLLSIVSVLVACNSSEPQKQTTADTSASSSADSIRKAVENSLQDTALHPTDSVIGVDSSRK